MQPAAEPLISIITLNYNQAGVTVDFLASSKKLQYTNYEILVCDMGSAEDPTLIIQPQLYHNTKLLLAGNNLGFAGGNNWAMRQAKGEFIFIVNNDTELTPHILTSLLAPFYANNNIGVTSAKIKFFDAPDIIQYAGFEPMHRFTARTAEIGNKQKDDGRFDVSGFTNGAHGCAMMVKREVIEKVGMFPEKFFLYYEEWDWSARILKAGYKIWYAADAVIYHKESMSVGKKNPMKVYYHTRNRILFMRRNASALNFFVFSLFFVFFTIPKSTFMFLRHKQIAHLKNFYKGIFWNLHSSSASPV
jgi:GT2 family glycosyltransferase